MKFVHGALQPIVLLLIIYSKHYHSHSFAPEMKISTFRFPCIFSVKTYKDSLEQSSSDPLLHAIPSLIQMIYSLLVVKFSPCRLLTLNLCSARTSH